MTRSACPDRRKRPGHLTPSLAAVRGPGGPSAMSVATGAAGHGVGAPGPAAAGGMFVSPNERPAGWPPHGHQLPRCRREHTAGRPVATTTRSSDSRGPSLPARVHRAPAPARRRGHQTGPRERQAIVAVAVVAGVVVAAFSPAQPTIFLVSDVVIRAGVAAVVTLAAVAGPPLDLAGPRRPRRGRRARRAVVRGVRRRAPWSAFVTSFFAPAPHLRRGRRRPARSRACCGSTTSASRGRRRSCS